MASSCSRETSPGRAQAAGAQLRAWEGMEPPSPPGEAEAEASGGLEAPFLPLQMEVTEHPPR